MNDTIEFILQNSQLFLNDGNNHIALIHETETSNYDCVIHDQHNEPVDIISINFLDATEKFSSSIHYFSNQGF